jgi:membrane protein required for colicin V production
LIGMNWLDIFLIVILALTVVIGALKGFLRQIIGLLAALIGLFLAIKYYPLGAGIFRFVSNQVLANLLGFFLIFIVVLCLGWVINILLAKAVRGPLKSLNHFLGGCLGFVKGVFICAVVVFALLVFPVNTRALEESQLAPYCIRIVKIAYDLIPQELKDKFSEAYQEIMGKRGKNEKRI